MYAMLNRVKNAMATLVGDIPDYPTSSERRQAGRRIGPASSLNGGSGRGGNGGVRGLQVRRNDADSRLAYNRPHFLFLSDDEVVASSDKTSRPIILPRDVTKVPWCAGYAEVINAGKSEVNEDQARAERIVLKNPNPTINPLKKAEPLKNSKSPSPLKSSSSPKDVGCYEEINSLKESKICTSFIPSKENHALEKSVPLDEAAQIDESNYVDVSKSLQEINTDRTEIDSISVDGHKMDENTEAYMLLKENEQITLTYFGIFDGHAGYGAALLAAKHLHYILTDHLLSILHLILSANKANENQKLTEPLSSNNLDLYSCCPCQCHRHQMLQKSRAPAVESCLAPFPKNDKISEITMEELVIGSIEMAFHSMDKEIESERKRFSDMLGGCTALVALFFMGKLFVANAGDCRAVICQDGKAIPVSFDFTPETERKRLHMMANLCPSLLHNEFTNLEFVRRPTRKDIGKSLLCREAWMSGWSLRVVSEEDLKVPIVTGEGKRARLLSTIGVTRGLGDHDLRLYESDIKIKPFLSSVPDIKVMDMNSSCHSENDVLVMASDGLWDVISSEQAAIIVQNSLSTVEISNPKRYTLAAQDLLMHARGMQQGQWKTIDDITVFVIPLHCYGSSSWKV